MVDRRQMLQVGCSSFLGMQLPGILQRQARAEFHSFHRAKSVVIVFLTGGGSHIDMFDPKPTASEAKGEFDPIATSLPGVFFSDRMPRLAERADRLSLVRSMSHGDNRHLSGTHNTLTGTVQPFRGDSNQAKSLHRDDWPSYGSVVNYLRPQADGLPAQVTLPNDLVEGVLVWPGQHSGFLGPKYDPFLLKDDPNGSDYRVRGLSLIDGLTIDRLNDRRRLLDRIDGQQRQLTQTLSGRKLGTDQDRAFSLLTSPRLKGALDIDAEDEETRDRYGRHKYGQSLLLARRLVELEMPVIQCNMGHVQMWDTHVDHFPRLKTMLPALDNGLSAFLDDLDDRGLMDQTLVICVGEFGRTPSISPLAGQKVPGRHHWASAYTALFAGAGVIRGQVIGTTDQVGGHPMTVPFHPNDLGATVFGALGIDPEMMIPDRLNRPRHLNRGKIMDVLYNGQPT